MKSHEVLREAFRRCSPKEVAAELGLSLSLVYKWAQEPDASGSGSRNPLDRLLEIIRITRDPRIVEWLCRRCGGYFVANPPADGESGRDVLPATSELVGQFSTLLHRISEAAADHSISHEEAVRIRRQWDRLMSCAESFVRCCEEGNFATIEDADRGGHPTVPGDA